MTSRVLAFDLNAGTRPQGGLTVTAAQLVALPPEPLPAQPRSPDRMRMRADLAATYAALLGVELAVPDLIERLQALSVSDWVDLPDIGRALEGFGLSVALHSDPAARADRWPALALMTSGAIVLVLGQEGGAVTVYDPTCPDARAEVPLVEFGPFYTGQVLVARTTMDEIATRHTDPGRLPHWFWGEFARHRRAVVEVAAGSLFANLLAVGVALFSLQVYDRVIPQQSEATLWVLAIGVLLALVFEGMLKVARSGLMDLTGKRIELAVQGFLMARVLGMKQVPGQRRPSQIITAMREFSSVREFFTASTIGTLADLPFTLIFFLLVAAIGGPVVWVLLLGALLMMLPGLLLQRRMVAITAAAQGASTRSARLLYETIIEAETVTTGRAEDRTKRLWSELSALTAATSVEQRRLMTGLSTWAMLVQQVTYVAAVVAGTYLVFAGDFTVGTIIAIGILTGRTLGPLTQLSSIFARWSQVKAALDGLDAIADAPQVEEKGRSYLRRDRILGTYELAGVSFRYDEKTPPTVDIPALAVPAGQHVAVLGTNGSGKSTLLRLLAGLYEPTAGRVLIDGVDLHQVHPRDLRRGVGYLAQEVRLIAGSLRDNLNLHGLERDDERMLAALDFAGLGQFVRSHPRGLDLPIGELGEGLSVGQRQSVGWARLWLQDPGVVILDEPTAALDQTLEGVIVGRMGGWLRGRTAVIATHRVPILSLTDRVVILQSGRLAVDGPRDAVLAHLMKAQGGPA